MLNNETFDVHLRALEPDDLEALYTIENDPESWEVSAANVPYSRYVLHQYMANTINDIYTDKQVRMIIATNEGKCVGLLDLFDFNPQHCRAEVGIVIHKKYRQKGYAKQALCLAKNYALRTLHLHQLYAFISNSNEASLLLFTSVGFTRQCFLKDWLFNGKEYTNAVLVQCIL